ncbi:MAG: DNA polymerase IV [Gammaproteobacteria bacterium]|nr:DNA polymerase IV [Gammaproteobacteria bacterium]
MLRGRPAAAGLRVHTSMVGRRRIIHIDMDAFYASIEQRDNPELRGCPVVVGGSGKRGVVAAASYEVREFGVRSAMPSTEAKRRCPDAVFIKPRMSHYQAVSSQIFRIFRGYTPLVEGLSLDEAFLDVTDSQKAQGDAESIGRTIKQDIMEATALTASVGIAPNKLVAKIASDLDKPDGFVVVSDEQIQAVLDPLPVRRLSGIGQRADQRLEKLGIRTLGQLRQASASQLRGAFGRYAESMRRRASGIDDRKVVADSADKSISHEETFDQDTADHSELTARLSRMADAVSSRLRKRNLVAATVVIKLRAADFSTFTRQQPMRPPGDHSAVIYRLAKELLERWLAQNPGKRLRLLGAGVTDLGAAEQLDLFETPGEESNMDDTVDAIRDKFGSGALKRGRSLR